MSNPVSHLYLELNENPDKIKLTDTAGKDHFVNSQKNVGIRSDDLLRKILVFDSNKKSYLRISNHKHLDMAAGESFTLSAWIKTTTTDDGSVICKWKDRVNGYRIYINQQGRIGVDLKADKTDPIPFDPQKTVADGTWHQIALVVNAGQNTASIYVDGIRDGDEIPDTNIANGFSNANQFRIGSNNYSKKFFTGSIAHLRIDNRALTPEEIRCDMAEDKIPGADSLRSQPLDIHFYNPDDYNILYIDREPRGHELTIEFRNCTRKEVILPGLDDTSPSSDCHHLALQFPQGTLAPECLDSENPNYLISLTSEDWKMSVDIDSERKATLYFLKKATADLTVPSGNSFSLTLAHLIADGRGGTRPAQVQFTCPKWRYAGQTDNQEMMRETILQIVNHRGHKNIPLHVGFVGANRILNDRETGQELTLRITNISKESAISWSNESKLLLSVDFQDTGENKDWALGTRNDLQNIKVNGESEVEEPRAAHGQGKMFQWTIKHEGDIFLEAGKHLDIKLTGIKSSLPSGLTNLTLQYQNIPNYWDGQFVCPIEKAPMIYRGQQIGIGVKPRPDGQELEVKGNTFFNGTVNLNRILKLRQRSGTEAAIAFIEKDGTASFKVDQTGSLRTRSLTIGEDVKIEEKRSRKKKSINFSIKKEKLLTMEHGGKVKVAGGDFQVGGVGDDEGLMTRVVTGEVGVHDNQLSLFSFPEKTAIHLEVVLMYQKYYSSGIEEFFLPQCQQATLLIHPTKTDMGVDILSVNVDNHDGRSHRNSFYRTSKGTGPSLIPFDDKRNEKTGKMEVSFAFWYQKSSTLKVYFKYLSSGYKANCKIGMKYMFLPMKGEGFS